MLRVALLIVALSAGGGAAWVALAMQSNPAIATIARPEPAVVMPEVLVASSDLAQGQVLSKENIRWQSWPESAINPAYITRSARRDAVETLSGSIVRSRVIAGEPLREEKLAPLNAGFLSAFLPAGKRAMAIRISAESTAGGFILPNDRVDVLHTIADQGQGDGPKPHVSRTILRNISVLAIDQTIDERAKDEKSKNEKSSPKAVVVGKTATLELNLLQAEVLAAAEATGTLSLVLRSAADNGESLPASEQERKTVRIVRSGRIDVVEVVKSQ
jgi:pilus assembly protein CpaB